MLYFVENRGAGERFIKEQELFIPTQQFIVKYIYTQGHIFQLHRTIALYIYIIILDRY
jgi:hypothetical protein